MVETRKKILVTGGSKGIGLGIARIFYHRDFEVIICARGEGDLKKAAATMPGLHTYVCDLSKKEAVKQLAAEINQKHGVLDVLVNNAGTFQMGEMHAEEDEVFELLMATNVSSAYYLTKALLPGMIERKQGTIFNVCSIASLMPYTSGSSYSISKYALLGFSKVLREEMKAHDIRVVALMPGAVYTDSWAASGLPPERFIAVEDIAKLVWNAYDLSDATVVEDIVVRPRLGDI